MDKKVIDLFKKVKDPETESSVYDLNLIYGYTLNDDSIDIFVNFQGNTPSCFFCKAIAWNIIEKISNDLIKTFKEAGFKKIRILEASNPNIFYKIYP